VPEAVARFFAILPETGGRFRISPCVLFFVVPHPRAVTVVYLLTCSRFVRRHPFQRATHFIAFPIRELVSHRGVQRYWGRANLTSLRARRWSPGGL